MSAPPSATRPNLTAEPSPAGPRRAVPSMKASVLLSPCERLTATIQGSPRGGKRAGTDRLGSGDAPPADRQPFGAAPDQPAPDQSQRRRADDAEQRRAVGHQREVDRELVAAGDELLGAVQRIDQEEAAAIRWLRQMRRSSDSAGISGASRARPSAMIRSAARSASVTGEPSVLPSTFIARAVDRKDCGAGPNHQFGQWLDQRGRGIADRSPVADECASSIGRPHCCSSSLNRCRPCAGRARFRSVSNQQACVIRL